MPAQKRLEGFDLVLLEIDDRLIEQLKLAVGKRASQVPLQRVAGQHVLAHFLFKETISAAAAVLGLVKRDIGSLQQFAAFGRILRRQRNADANVHDNLMSIEIERLVNRLPDPQGEVGGVRTLIKQRLDDGEFVAA